MDDIHPSMTRKMETAMKIEPRSLSFVEIDDRLTPYNKMNKI